MALIPILEELPIPFDQIIRQARGDISEALEIAAAYGYGCACRDLERITKSKVITGMRK